MRYLLIPMIGTGKPNDRHHPKYVEELGLGYSIRNARTFCLAEVWGEGALIDQVASQADVVEIEDTDDAVPSDKIDKIERTVALSKRSSGKVVLSDIRETIHAGQLAEQAQRVTAGKG